jgi:WD40 repeat protein
VEESVVATLRLVNPDAPGGGHEGDVLACAYSPDGHFVLSAGWDGFLRLWETNQGAQVTQIKTGARPLSACAVAPDGRRWLAGSMDGMLASWDPMLQTQSQMFLAHTRPISAIVYSADGVLGTTSWDRQITLWDRTREREGRSLNGHGDIVSGGRFTPDGRSFVSWSHDRTVRVWESARARSAAELTGHADRILTGAVCPDGRWAATGSRDGDVKLWDLAGLEEAGAVTLAAEVRACFFLLDAASLVTVDSNGFLQMFSIPELQPQGEFTTRMPVLCGDLSPSGGQIALGCSDGGVCLVAVDGFDTTPLMVTPTQSSRQTANLLERLLGKHRLIPTYECTCPACRQSFELPTQVPDQPASCPACRRSLRLSPLVMPAREAIRSR